jgi:hypothetical protein
MELTSIFILVETGLDTSISKEAREFASKPESNEMTRCNSRYCKIISSSNYHKFYHKIHSSTKNENENV